MMLNKGEENATRSESYELYEITNDSDTGPLLNFTVPRDLADGIINNKKEAFKFSFENIFDQNTKQDEVFAHVAKPVADNVLEGYNGTIFAYGQTGSGKTFTITGGAERFTDRGIIPRTLSYIFDYYKQNSEYVFTTHISYLEIYNDSGYDLLDPKHEASKLEDLPKVHLMEDSDQNIHLKNLSTHPANSEEESLNLLFLGDTNRMIAETPMNQASTRSHCIFTIHISSRAAGSATIRRSKLHLVDLAGSERVSKTGVNGVLLTEAKYINLSLHYLEQVIVSLSEKSRQHIPYRNSMMTSVLRDSLGGNCMTTMIATCSIDKRNLGESISTCRFAQRVAMIKNDAILNEELDPKLMIARLKKEIQQLKEELAMATGEQRTDELTAEDMERCEEAVKNFLQDPDPETSINIGADMRKIHHCFGLMKRRVGDGKSGRPHSTPSSVSTINEEISLPTAPAQSTEAKRLQELIRQRDNEINILVNMLKKEKKRSADAIKQLESGGTYVPTQPQSSASQRGTSVNGHAEASSPIRGSTASKSSVKPGSSRSESQAQWKQRDEETKKKILGEMSMGRQEAFEIFRRDYEHNDAIEDNKAMLKQCYSQAKGLGQTVNTTKSKINRLKTSLEQHRMSRVMQGLVDTENPEPDDLEREMRSQLEEEKQRYKDAFTHLRSLKSEIEHLQHLLENSKVKLMKDFEMWWAEQASRSQEQQKPGLPTPRGRSAWQTPPITPNNASHSKPDSSQLRTSSTGGMRSGSDLGPLRTPSATGSRPGSDSGHHSRPSASRQPSGVSHSNSAPAFDTGGIPLTGDTQADADIMAFMKARQNIARHAQSQGRR